MPWTGYGDPAQVNVSGSRVQLSVQTVLFSVANKISKKNSRVNETKQKRLS